MLVHINELQALNVALAFCKDYHDPNIYYDMNSDMLLCTNGYCGFLIKYGDKPFIETECNIYRIKQENFALSLTSTLSYIDITELIDTSCTYSDKTMAFALFNKALKYEHKPNTPDKPAEWLNYGASAKNLSVCSSFMHKACGKDINPVLTITNNIKNGMTLPWYILRVREYVNKTGSPIQLMTCSCSYYIDEKSSFVFIDGTVKKISNVSSLTTLLNLNIVATHLRVAI